MVAFKTVNLDDPVRIRAWTLLTESNHTPCRISVIVTPHPWKMELHVQFMGLTLRLPVLPQLLLMVLVARPCHYCGSPVERQYSRARIPNLLFCNTECRKLGLRKRVQLNCYTCDASFERLPSELHDGKYFCSSSCSASHTNKERKEPNPCRQCATDLPSRRKFCTTACADMFRYRTFIDEWKQGHHQTFLSAYIRRWLREQKNECWQCGWKEVHPVTGIIPVQVDHIDGKSKNNSPENLRLLCPNCHVLTDTYGALNKGNCDRDYYIVRK